MAMAMATVIPLVAPNRDRSKPSAVDRVSTDRALAVLQRRAGDRAAELPPALGRAAMRLEALLAQGPTSVDPSSVDPTRAVASAERILKVTATLFDLIGEEEEVLSEALASDLGSLGLNALSEAVEAVLGLSEAPRAVASWGRAAAAEAAEMVLQVAAEDLRAAAGAHERLYQHFTEAIWHVPGTVLHAGLRPWHPISRARLRRELRAVSRTGRVRGLTATTKEVLEVEAARGRLASMAPLLSHHLAELDRGPLSDADGALAAISAVRRLQAALGDLLDEDRLERLLLADAFRSLDVVGPAVRLRNALRAWGADVKSVEGAEACGLSQAELAQWAAEVSHLLPALIEGHNATERLGISAPTLRAIVDILLVREHVQDLQADEGLRRGSEQATGAS